jgi:DNA-binding NarL/FixJ family response regulator
MTEDRIRGYKIGCRAYLAKPFDPEELVAVIDNILSDKKNIKNINNIKKEIQDLRKEINSFNKFNQNLTFTKREINILLAISKGLSNKDIANKLKISVRNVEKYVTRLLNKTNVSNRVKLANYRYLYNNGE